MRATQTQNPALSPTIVHFNSSHARLPLACHAGRRGESLGGMEEGSEGRGCGVMVGWVGGDKEEKRAMIDLSHRHLTLSLQLIRPPFSSAVGCFCVSINTGPNQYLCCTVYLAAVQPFSV